MKRPCFDKYSLVPNGTCNTCGISHGHRYWLIFSKSHAPFSASIRSETKLGKWEGIGRLVRSSPEPSEVNQDAPYIGVFIMFPILLRKQVSRICLLPIILLQVHDGLSPTSARKNLELGKYRGLRIWERRRSGLVVIRHACFVSKAKLKLAICRKPMPPSTFGLHNRAQAIHEIPLESFEPHQNLMIIFSTSSNMDAGNMKHDIT